MSEHVQGVPIGRSIDVGAASHHHRTGELGARVTVAINDAAGGVGIYHFGTHGKTAAEIAAEHAAIVSFHNKRQARIATFGEVRIALTVSGVRYEITDCVVVRRGTDVELLVAAKGPGEARVQISQVHRSIDEVPTNAEILAAVRAAIAEQISKQEVAAAHASAVRQILGVEG